MADIGELSSVPLICLSAATVLFANVYLLEDGSIYVYGDKVRKTTYVFCRGRMLIIIVI